MKIYIISFLFTTITYIVICAIKAFIDIRRKDKKKNYDIFSFSVSDYYDRTEKELLKILEEYKPVDQTIVLWLGFDGLRLNEDGSIEWISRKKPEPINQSVFYQPCQSIAIFPQFNVCQSTQATIETLQWRMTQMQTANAITMQQQHLLSQMQNCCCNTIIGR